LLDTVFGLAYPVVLFIDNFLMFRFQLEESFFGLKDFFFPGNFSFGLRFTYYFAALVPERHLPYEVRGTEAKYQRGHAKDYQQSCA
jgi:hypothetical protein